MSFQAKCPHCQKQATAPDGAEGKRLRCPHCQEMYAVHQEAEGVIAVPVSPAAPALHTVWEYHIEDISEAVLAAGVTGRTPAEKKKALSVPIQQRLNALGAEGWELTASEYVAPSSSTLSEQLGFWKLVFKRPRRMS